MINDKKKLMTLNIVNSHETMYHYVRLDDKINDSKVKVQYVASFLQHKNKTL